MLRVRSEGWKKLRLAERAFCAMRLKLPPRMTRSTEPPVDKGSGLWENSDS